MKNTITIIMKITVRKYIFFELYYSLIFLFILVLKRFQYTQDESLYNQLAYGIRYMDWRVGVYNHTLKTSNGETKKIEEFWMVHDISRNRITLKQAIGQVKRFLEQTTSEIIIIDFHRFVHGFDKVKDIQAIRRRLDTFVKLLEDHFGPFLIPYRFVF